MMGPRNKGKEFWAIVATLFVLFVLGVGVSASKVSASGVLPSVANAPNATNTPRPTTIPDVRKFPGFVVSSDWATPENAWTQLYAQSKLPVPLAGSLCLTIAHKVKGYMKLSINASATPSWSATPNAGSYPSSGRAYVIGSC